jgi:hypothetical protein
VVPQSSDEGGGVTISLAPNPLPSEAGLYVQVSASLNGHALTNQQMYSAISNLEETNIRFSRPVVEDVHLNPDLWNNRVQRQEIQEDTLPYNDSYTKSIFGSIPSTEMARDILFCGSPVASIDTITWAVAVARCRFWQSPESIAERMRELANVLTGEQWFDLWTGEASLQDAELLVFNCHVNTWLCIPIAKVARDMLIDPEILKTKGPRMASHLLAQALRRPAI